jgi:hypothetical protein
MRNSLERVNTPRSFGLKVTFDEHTLMNNKDLAKALRDVAVQIEGAPHTAGMSGSLIYAGWRVGSWAFKDGVRD